MHYIPEYKAMPNTNNGWGLALTYIYQYQKAFLTYLYTHKILHALHTSKYHLCMLKPLRTWSVSIAHLSLTYKTHTETLETALNVPIWNVSLTLNCFLQHTVCLKTFHSLLCLVVVKTEPLQFVRLDTACHVSHAVHWNSGLPASVWRTPPSVPTLPFNSTPSLQHNLADWQQNKKCELK